MFCNGCQYSKAIEANYYICCHPIIEDIYRRNYHLYSKDKRPAGWEIESEALDALGIKAPNIALWPLSLRRNSIEYCGGYSIDRFNPED